MRPGGLVLVTAATLLACCYANSQQDQNLSGGERKMNYENTDNKEGGRSGLAGAEEGQLRRRVREAHGFPYTMVNRPEYGSSYGGRRYPWPFAAPIEYGYYGEGLPKRNFDEIDRSNLDSFVRKRNFDEIDQTSMPFPSKRRILITGLADAKWGSNLDGFPTKRNFDEIDHTSMPFPSKRRLLISTLGDSKWRKNYFDEIDNTNLPLPQHRRLLLDILSDAQRRFVRSSQWADGGYENLNQVTGTGVPLTDPTGTNPL